MKLASALVAVLLAATPALSEGERATLEVEQPGTVAAAIPIEWTTSGPPRLSVTAPSGRTVPHHLIDRSATRPPLTLAIESVRNTDEGWEIEARLPPGAAADQPSCTTGLELELGAVRVVFERVEVEGQTAPSGVWRALARDRLFQLGNAAEARRLALWWPPTEASALRVTLSGSTSEHAPDIVGLEAHLCRAPAEDLEIAVQPTCRHQGKVFECEATLPDRPIHQVELGVAGAIDSSATWRLSGGRAGRWVTQAEGTGSARPTRLVVGVGDLRDQAVRFEITAPGPFTDPVIIARGPGLVLEIDATEAGTYRVARTAGTGSLMARPISPTVAWRPLVPGAGDTPSAAVARGAELSGHFERQWPIVGDVAAGSSAAIELTAEVFAAARSDLGDVRIAARGSQVPFRLRELPGGAPVATAPGLQPRASTRPGVSEVALAVEEPGLPLTAIEIRAVGPFSRSLRVMEEVPESPGVPAGRRQLTAAQLVCERSDQLPCTVSLALQHRSPVRLVVESDDGDAAPLGDIELRIARKRVVAEFRYPEDPVSLLAGNPSAAAPRYDAVALQQIGTPTLLQLGSAEAAPAEGHGRLLVVAALAAAALALVVVLRRQL